jgi:hypothetical protein
MQRACSVHACGELEQHLETEALGIGARAAGVEHVAEREHECQQLRGALRGAHALDAGGDGLQLRLQVVAARLEGEHRQPARQPLPEAAHLVGVKVEGEGYVSTLHISRGYTMRI